MLSESPWDLLGSSVDVDNIMAISETIEARAAACCVRTHIFIV